MPPCKQHPYQGSCKPFRKRSIIYWKTTLLNVAIQYGMKNVPAIFQRLINSLTSDWRAVRGNVVIYNDNWQHVQHLWALLERLT